MLYKPIQDKDGDSEREESIIGTDKTTPEENPYWN